jgi:hypothetical protein
MDIIRAEEVVDRVKQSKVINKNQKTILNENNWTKYRHLFVSRLSNVEIVAINKFFDSCIAIDDAKIRLSAIFDAGLIAKARIVQEKIFSIENLFTPEGQIAKQKYINESNQETHIFSPDEPIGILVDQVQSMVPLTNTPAYEKLQRIAVSKTWFGPRKK